MLAAGTPVGRAVRIALHHVKRSAPRSADTAARSGDRPARDRARALARRALHPRPERLDDRRELGVRDAARAAATGRPRPPSSLRPSRCCRSRRRCAGRAARRRAVGSGRRRARARGIAPTSNSAASRSGPSAASRWSNRVRPSVMSSSSGPSNSTTSVAPARSTSHARDDERPQRRPPAYTPHTPLIPRCEWITRSPSNRRNRCLPCVSMLVTVRPASRCGQRSSPWRGCGVRISSGTRRSRIGRIR